MLNLSPTGAQGSSGQSASQSVPGKLFGAMHVDVSAVSGSTPTLEVKLQESADNVNFVDIASFTTASLTATGTVRIDNPRPAQVIEGYVRAVWTLGGGTPDFTFTVQVTETEV